ncbi:Scr1 family TA system antitoxin-like transcriptional regulator [Streptomyces chlorus]|uniref:Scr1 family TA system antitoxin-like transcriptional regulator n=1 Tax=Streptomyces chlorus TaxID=887452 RepID=A0ABW1DZE9_9ACTN
MELQIMPLRQRYHAGTDGPMQLLETPERQWLGYAEGQKTGQLVSDREAVSVMQMRYAKMRLQALSRRTRWSCCSGCEECYEHRQRAGLVQEQLQRVRG